MMGMREKVVEGMLQLAVQSVEWTYSLYWRFSIQQRMLVWGDGFYNGPIKTTKTLHPAEQPPSLSTLHRTHQLRDLYNSLSSADHPLRRPSAALSPEDLTESEWFYLLCLSFSFPPGLGLPGKAFAKNKHVWITGANEIDTKIFSRAILAKSARIKTVVCIPLMDGVVELGTTEKVNEDMGLIQHIKSIFAENQWGAPKAALSELSTSNSATSLEHNYNNLHSSSGVPAKRKELENDQMDWDSSTSNRNGNGNGNGNAAAAASPLGNSPAPVEDTHYYSNTLSALLLKLNQSTPWPDSSSVTCSTQSAFSNWTRRSHLHRLPTETTTTSQCLLKNILHTVPFLIHTKRIHSHHNPQNHFLARTEKLNDKFIILRSIVPFATKMDKASILGDTVEYLKQLRQKIQDLEAQNREFESNRRTSFEELQRNAAAPGTCLDKRKLRILEGVGDGCTVLKPPPCPPSPIASLDTNLQVSIIGSDGLLELQCPYKEGLLLDILLVLQGLRIETTAVRSSMNNGVFIAELRAKVKENMDGKKASILEVKRAIQQIIPCIDT